MQEVKKKKKKRGLGGWGVEKSILKINGNT